MRGYSATDVTRIESRSIEAVDRPGVSFYEIDITLRFAGSERAETMTELGDVLPRVQIEPDRLFLALPPGTTAVEVDGVKTTVSGVQVPDHGEVFPVLLLKGEHEIRVGAVTAVINTGPLAVVSGDGEVVRDVDQAGIVRIG